MAQRDGKRIVAVYHRLSDVTSEFRADMYTGEGKPLNKMTSDAMAVHFPDTIQWSPDSSSVAFVAMLRVTQTPIASSANSNSSTGSTHANSMVSNSNSAANTATSADTNTFVEPTPSTDYGPAAPTRVLTFRTEQIYLANADGIAVKPVTENEGLIYFYYAWSPDSSMLVALATTLREWSQWEIYAAQKGEVMIPQGRPRVIEKNGRERRLDDNPTTVQPVWSPDSSKIAAAFGTHIRVYDAVGTNPTQAAIPLKNQLLLSSQNYDREQQRQLQASETNDANTAASPTPTVEATPEQPLSTLPDEKLLVSFNPIVELMWTADDLLYLKTAYVRRMQNTADNVTSFARWHRLALSAQKETTK